LQCDIILTIFYIITNTLFSFALVLTERFADLSHGSEDHTREGNRELDGLHVGQLDTQGFVLWGVSQVSVRLDSIFIQSPVCLQQPGALLLPPDGMIGPVLRSL